MGFVAHVPHYLSEADHPDASLVLLRSIAAATGLALPADALAEAAGVTRKLVQEQVDQSEEVGRVVRALETQFDAFVGGTDRGSLLAGPGRHAECGRDRRPSSSASWPTWATTGPQRTVLPTEAEHSRSIPSTW